jgi:ABC-2 type transport system permease protein
MTKHFFGDTTVLLGRSLRHITRSPDTIITTTIMPIAQQRRSIRRCASQLPEGGD